MPVSQSDLTRALKLQARIAEASKSLKALEASIKQSLEDGAAVEHGARSASLKTTPGRRSVSWRAVVERLKSSGYCAQVIAGTKRGPDTIQLKIL